jgi:hypothetical protein
MPRAGTKQVNVILTEETDQMLTAYCLATKRSRSNASQLLLEAGLRDAKRDGVFKLPPKPKPAPVPE